MACAILHIGPEHRRLWSSHRNADAASHTKQRFTDREEKNMTITTLKANFAKTAIVAVITGATFFTALASVEAAPVRFSTAPAGVTDTNVVENVQMRRRQMRRNNRGMRRNSRRNRNAAIGLGIAGAIVGAAIASRSYARECWYERERVWSRRYGRYVVRKIKVCD